MLLPQTNTGKDAKHVCEVWRQQSVMSTEAKNAAGGSCQRNQSLDKLMRMIQMWKTQTGG